MAPVPLINKNRECSFTVGHPNTFMERPELSAAFAGAIAAWSYAEQQYGTILIQLLGAHSEPALAMLHSLRSSAAQDEALMAAAAKALAANEEASDLFVAAMAVARRQRKQRNRLAHGVVGYSDQIPDGIIIVDAQVCNVLWLDMFVKRHFATIDPKAFSKQAFDEFAKAALVYKKPDLEECVKAFDEVAEILVNIAVIVSEVHHGKAQALEELRSLPVIQEEKHRRQKRLKSSP